ncbi:hypothetical protein PLIIFM63780_004400 [Purpureocillium lilacinum]|nr:hypothetical protein PLIIFM63780_004400 [Purpureocillium lilacinum]
MEDLATDWPMTRTDSDEDVANLKDGDCQIPLAGKRDMANKRLVQAHASDVHHEDELQTSSAKYWRNVHPFMPFVPAEMLEEADLGRDPDLEHCVDLASRLSFNFINEDVEGPLLTDQLLSMLRHGSLSNSAIAGLLLLIPSIPLEEGLVQQIFLMVESASAAGSVPPPILSGALITHIWRQLAGYSHPPLRLQSDILQSYAESLSPTTPAHHFIRLSQLAVELGQRRMAMSLEGIQPDTSLAWAKLEYDFLLWQVRLPTTLLDGRDDLPATPQSVLMHCLSSMLLLSFYSDVLEHADTLGVQMALRPVPGVLLFLCALARSTFICPRNLLDRWALLLHMQAATVRIMLRLWRQTGFENCRALCNLWEDSHNLFPDLKQQVREEIGTGPWTIEEIDGYSVFWTFRDLRTLAAKFIIDSRNMTP